MPETPLTNKANILSELWLNYRTDDQFKDFVEYNDLGLPLSYVLSQGIVSYTPQAESFVNETFSLLLEALDIEEDLGYDDLYDVLGE